MKLSIISYFHNATGYIPRYMEQMESLQFALDGELSLVLGYGDSDDGTGEMLYEETVNRFDALLLDVSHGGKVHGSVVDAERFRQLSVIGNVLWAALPQDSDTVGLVESDLVWETEDLLKLVEGLGEAEMRAPMVYDQNGDFYDSWAFRCQGKRFLNQFPYHRSVGKGRYLNMDSVGSVFFLRYPYANQLYFPAEDVVVGFCRQARRLGVSINLDTTARVYHP